MVSIEEGVVKFECLVGGGNSNSLNNLRKSSESADEFRGLVRGGEGSLILRGGFWELELRDEEMGRVDVGFDGGEGSLGGAAEHCFYFGG